MLKCFTCLLLFWPHAVAQGGKREKEVQLMLHNVKTDRQSSHKPKSDSGFRQTIQTPVTLGLQLTSYQKVRSKVLIDDVSELNIGSLYPAVINVEKRIESAVLERMNTSGGYCLPSFMKRGLHPFLCLIT